MNPLDVLAVVGVVAGGGAFAGAMWFSQGDDGEAAGLADFAGGPDSRDPPGHEELQSFADEQGFAGFVDEEGNFRIEIPVSPEILQRWAEERRREEEGDGPPSEQQAPGASSE